MKIKSIKPIAISFGLAAIMALGFASSAKNAVAVNAVTGDVYKTVLFGASYNSKGVGAYTGTWSSTNNDFTVDIENFNNNNNGWSYVKTGNKAAASVGTITTATAIDKAIDSVTLTIDAITASSVNSIKLYTGTSASNITTEVGSFAKAKGEQSVSIPSPAENLYYKLVFDCAKGSSNGLVTLSKVEYYESVEEGATLKSLDSISVSGESHRYFVGDTFEFDGVVRASYDNGTSATVEPTSVSTPDMSTAGTKTITVTYTEGSITKTADYSITVAEDTFSNKVFDLSTDTTKTATEDALTWESTPISMEFTKGTSPANNYYPGVDSRTSTRIYSNGQININGSETNKIERVELLAANDNYAIACVKNTWTDVEARRVGSLVIVTPNSPTATITSVASATQGFKSIKVYYSGSSTPVTPDPEPTEDEFAIVAPDEMDYDSIMNYSFENALPENQRSAFVVWVANDDVQYSMNAPDSNEINIDTNENAVITTLKSARTFYIHAYYTVNANGSVVYATKQVTINYGLSNLVSDFGELRTYCNNGVNPNVAEITSTWEIIADYWNDLSASEQSTFKATVANASAATTTLENTAALYDLLVAKYNLTNFASRSVSSMSRGLKSITKDTATTAAIVAVAAVSSISLVGALAVSKKRKEN